MCVYYKYNHKIRTVPIRTTPIHKVLGFLLAMCVCSSAWAIDMLDGRLQVHGFIAQGMVNTSGNNFLGETNDSVSYDFREVGLNASYRALPQLLFSGQIMSHRAGESDEGDPDIDYAFVDWIAASGDWGRAGVRLGRVKNPFGLYNKTRDVPFTRPSVILPQSIYFERTRKISVSADGVNLYVEKFGPLGVFSAEVVLGRPPMDKASDEAIVANAKGDFETDDTQLYQLKYESPTGQYVLAVTHVNLGIKYKPAAGDSLKAGYFHFDPTILSAQYNAENWSATAEYARRSYGLRNFGMPALSVSQVGESYYLQGTYRVLPKLEGLLRYDVAYSNKDDRSGREYAALTHKPGFTQYTKDWTIGLRYDVTPAFMIRAEYHNIEGTAILPSLDNPLGSGSHEKDWDMWMLLGSYHF